MTGLAWLYLVVAARAMDGASMAGMAARPWSALDFALMLAMWAIMMVAMMVPSAVPMVLVYAQVARKAAREGSPLPPALVFVAGYVVAWTGFSAAATLAQWGLDRLGLLSPMMTTTHAGLGLALLLGAALYQLSPWKDACLEHCRAPALYFAEHFRPGAAGAFRLGLHHGAYCLGCCWVLMALLFVGGVMNLLWIAALAAFVLLEKTLPFARRTLRVGGAALLLLLAAGFAARALAAGA